MPLSALETLRQVNHNLRSALAGFLPERRHCSTIKPQDFAEILHQLLRASECLRGIPSHSEANAALDKETLEYRNNLQELRHSLPDVNVRLLAEKSRLETARNHLAAAASWERANKKTL